MLNLKIVSPSGVLFDNSVESVMVPGTLGPFEILNNHAPIISSLEPGEVSFKTGDGKLETKRIEGGFVEVQKNEVRLCVEL